MSNSFDILISQVNGLTRMNEKPKSYEQQVNDFITDQISNGVKSFIKMDELDKDRLCTLMTQALHHDREYSIIDMPELNEVVTYLLEYINCTSDLNTKAYDLAEKMRFELWKRFEYQADELFEQIAHDLYVADCEENGLRRHVDPINGEVRWY